MIIFYNPQSSANKKPILPMSILAVSAVLDGLYEYQILDGNLLADSLTALREVIENAGINPILACTVMPGPQLEQAVPLCRELKKQFPQLTIIWGGYFPTQHWQACLNSDFVDYVLRGHSEFPFLQLIKELGNTLQSPISNLHSLPGVAYRDSAGIPQTNTLAPIPKPDTLPPWNFDKIDVNRYVRKTFLGSRTLGYHSSYGCPFFCNFCAVVNMVNGKWIPQQSATVGDIAQLYVERWGVNAIEFYDNNFFTSEKRVAQFCQDLLERDLQINWWGEGRIDTMQKYSDATWELMRDAGLKMVFMGAESGSAETLKRMNKGGTQTPDKTLAMAEKMAKYGIVPEYSFVMGNPPNPEEDARQTMEFIREVKRVNPATEVILYLYTPVPLSGELYDQAKADGFAFPETLEEWVSEEWLAFSQRRSQTMPWIKQPLQGKLHDFERVINAYYPTSTDSKLTAGWRKALRLLSAWRYHTRIYRFPLELRAVHKFIAYQRPETSGF